MMHNWTNLFYIVTISKRINGSVSSKNFILMYILNVSLYYSESKFVWTNRLTVEIYFDIQEMFTLVETINNY